MKSLRLACLLTILLNTLALSQSTPDLAAQGKIVETYGKLPLTFETNQGQTDAKVKFLSRGSGYTLSLTGDEAVFSLRGSEAKPNTSLVGELRPRAVVPTTKAVLRMKLRNANPAAMVTGADELPGKSNYFIGNDPKKWRSNVPTYGKVKYEGVYSGIDLIYYGNQRQLEYDFIVAPGADPHRIQFDVRGATRISRDEHGDLVLQTTAGDVRWRKPVAYQEKDGERQEIEGRYVIRHGQRVGFELAGYDAKRPLIIDPVLGYSTYLGGIEQGTAVDSSGNAYVTGYTGGPFHAFVTKLNPTGSALIYSTYLGGSGNDYGYGIAVDSSGNAFVTGSTNSTNFPTTPGAFQTSCAGRGCAFVAEINLSGSALVYSTYLGGSGYDSSQGIAVDSSGNAFVTGYTFSTDFPVTPGAFQTTCGEGCGASEAFVTALNSSGSALVYSTYLGAGGGQNGDTGSAIALGVSENAYVTGNTYSQGFPTTPGAFQTKCNSCGLTSDGFVTEFNAAGSALVYSTYLGGSGYDFGYGIAVDSSGNAHVTGSTNS
ncbi:MAG: SBBP repeat-containing protein, partial [Terriglobales bacterium]